MMPTSASLIAASSSWFGIISLVATVLGSIGVGSMLKTWLDYRRGMRGADDNAAMELIKQQGIALARANKRIDRLDRAQRRKDELYELRMGQLRHRLNNMRMIFEVVIHLMKTNAPEQLPDIVKLIEDMRAKHEIEEAEETKAIIAAFAAGQLADREDESEEDEE